MDDFVIFFITILISILIIKNIYTKNEFIRILSEKDGIEYIVRDRHDSILSVQKLETINEKVKLLINNLDENNEEAKLLKKKYNPHSLSETGGNSTHTSYSVNKGEKISICLRKKENEDIFEDENTIMFVMIHELAHIITKSIGHTEEFWNNMKFLLKEANKLNIYLPIDYNKTNVEYCGMLIKSTPYDFKK